MWRRIAWLPTFRRNLLSTVEEDGNRGVLRNLCNHLPNCMTSHPRRPESKYHYGTFIVLICHISVWSFPDPEINSPLRRSRLVLSSLRCRNMLRPVYLQISRYSDWLRVGRQRGRSSSPGTVKNFLFSTSSRSVLGPTQPPIQWVPGGSYPGAWRWPLTSN
jgi:hypothetical protein